MKIPKENKEICKRCYMDFNKTKRAKKQFEGYWRANLVICPASHTDEIEEFSKSCPYYLELILAND
jgi:hypothetical protein